LPASGFCDWAGNTFGRSKWRAAGRVWLEKPVVTPHGGAHRCTRKTPYARQGYADGLAPVRTTGLEGRRVTRIALIHATLVAMQPVEAAFQRLWPEAERVNLLDDALSRDRARTVALTPALAGRIRALADYAISRLGADGVLFTCSAFGEAIEAAARAADRPVLKPNEAMFEEALRYGRRIGMLATFEPSVASMEQEFRELTAARGVLASLETVCVPEAMAALSNGDAAGHNRLLADAASALSGCDAILLAQFSTSIAAEAVASRVSAPVVTSPASAVLKLKGSMDSTRSGL
jgi:Asp/Glu/hydantoin racemase